MRGLKTLSPILLVALTMIFMGSATAQVEDTEFETTLPNQGNQIAFSDDYVAVVAGSELQLYDYEGNKQKTFVDRSVGNIAFAQDGDIVYNSGDDVYRMDTGFNQEWSNTAVAGNGIRDIATTPNKNILIADGDGTTRSLDGATGDQNWGFSGHGNSVNTVETDGDYIYAGDGDWAVHKLGTDGNEIWQYKEQSDNVIDLHYDSSGNIYSASKDGTIHKIDSDGNQLWTYDTAGYTRGVRVNGDHVYAIADSTMFKLSKQGEEVKTYDYGSQQNDLAVYSNLIGTTGMGNEVDVLTYYTLPNSTTVSEDTTNLVTGDFALATSAGTIGALKGIGVGGAIAGGLATWEFGIRDWLFGTNDADSELWKTDIRSNAVTLEDQRKNLLNASELSEDAIFGDAMATARSQGVQAFNNGSTRSESKQQVENTVEDYYSDIERTVVNGYNNEILNLQQDKNNAENIDGVSFSDVFKSDFQNLAVVDTNYTLPNGEKIKTYEVVDDTGTTITTLEDNSGTGLTTTSGSDYNSSQYISGSAHYEVIQGVRDTRSNAITNVNSIVDNIYDNYEQGRINVSDELSALELTESMSTNYAETGSYNYAAASLARTGQPTDLNSAFTITYSNETYEGALFATEAVVGTEVESGTTYNGADGNAVFVAQGENTADLIELRDEFTVTEIRSTDSGEKLNQTELQSESAYTADVTDLQKEINSLEKLYEEQQNALNGGTTGPTGGFFSGTSGMLMTVIGVLALILVGANIA